MVIINKDKENKIYTLYLLEKGGPIISDASLDKAKEKFKNAFNLALAVQKLQNFKSIN